MKTIEQDLNIIDFIRHPSILNDQSMSLSQIVFLKSVYGLPLTAAEFEIYRAGTGREKRICLWGTARSDAFGRSQRRKDWQARGENCNI